MDFLNGFSPDLWWSGLSLLEQIFYLAAIPSSLYFLLQAALMLFGIGGAELDIVDSAELDGPDTLDSGFQWFSLKGIMAFLCVGGWTGISMIRTGSPAPATVGVSIVMGLAALALTALMLKWVLGFRHDGTVQYKDLIGERGTAYIPIPPIRSPGGKVTLALPSGIKEFDAVTDQGEPIKTGDPIRVVSNEESVLIVVKDEFTSEGEIV